MKTAERTVHEIYDDDFIELAKEKKFKVEDVISYTGLDIKELVLSIYGTIQECWGDGIELLRQEGPEKIRRYLCKLKSGDYLTLGDYNLNDDSSLFNTYKKWLQEANIWEEKEA